MTKALWCVLLLCPLLAQAESIRDVAREPMVSLMSKQCVSSGASSDTGKSLNLSDGRLKSYCDCATGKLFDELTEDDLVNIMDGKLQASSPEFKAKMAKGVYACVHYLMK